MRILHIVNDHFSHMSGYAIRTGYIVRFQKEAGLNVAAIVSPYHNYIDNNVERIGKTISLDGIQFYQTGIHVSIAKSLIQVSPRIYRWIEALLFEQHILNAVEKLQWVPDIIHAHSPYLVGLPALRAARRLKVPFVYEVRDFWEESAVANGRFAADSARHLSHRRLENSLMKQSDGLVSISGSLLQEIERRGVAPRETLVVSNGVDPTSFLIDSLVEKQGREIRQKFGVENNQVLLGFVGALRPYENLGDLLHAVSLLRQSSVNVKVMFVGDGESRLELETLARKLALESHVIFVGRVAHQEISNYYSAIDIFVLARSSKHVSLVMPLKPLEALATAKPLLVADLPVMHEIVQNNVTGMFYPAGDIKVLSERILQMVNEPELRVRLGRQARNWLLEHSTWKMVTNQYPEFYERVILSS